MTGKKSIARPFSLSKFERLKSRKLIGELFTAGKSLNVPPVRASFMFVSSDAPLQAGFSVSSRNFKKAVDRNRIKRLLREAYRLEKQPLLHILQLRKLQLAVFFIYTGRDLPESGLIRTKMAEMISLLCKRIENIPGERSTGK